MNKDIEMRIPEGKRNADKAYSKFIKRIMILKNHKASYINCILKFLEVAENKTSAELVTILDNIKDEDTEHLMRECIKICREAVNRDFISFISTGDRGNIGNAVYNSLNHDFISTSDR